MIFKWSYRRSESRKQDLTSDPKCPVIELCYLPAVPPFPGAPPDKRDLRYGSISINIDDYFWVISRRVVISGDHVFHLVK